MMYMHLCGSHSDRYQCRFYPKSRNKPVLPTIANVLSIQNTRNEQNMRLDAGIEPFHKIHFKNLAREIAKREHGKKQVDIAQISEVLKNALDILGEEWKTNPLGVGQLLEKRSKSKRKLLK